MARLHHVNLGILPDQLEAEAAFLVDVLVYEPVDPGPELAGRAHWFVADDGTEIHLSLDPEHRPAARAHVALDLGSALAAAESRLDAHGHAFATGPVQPQDGRVIVCADPAGNRWELRGTAG